MNSITFTLPGIAVPWARAGRKGGFSYTPSKQRTAMAEVKLMAERAMNGQPLLEGPLIMMLDAVYPWPKSITKKRRRSMFGHYKETRPDLGNIVKLVEDAMNGVVYKDDAQICKYLASKYYSASARLTVTIQPLEGIAGESQRTEPAPSVRPGVQLPRPAPNIGEAG